MNFMEQLPGYRAYLKREEKSGATQEKYLRDVRAFVCFVGDREITKELVLEWKRNLSVQGYAARSINSMLASVNSLLQYLGCPELRVKNLRIQKPTYAADSQELTKEEYFRLLRASAGKKQLHLVLQAICGTGIRVSELRYFTVEAVSRGEIHIDNKGKNRRILLPKKLQKMLLCYARSRGTCEGAIFLGKNGKPLDRSYIWRQMKALCAVAGVCNSKVFPHNLRKLFARTFYALEKDIAKLADILGHSSIDTTRIYLVTSGREHRRKIERLGLLQ